MSDHPKFMYACEPDDHAIVECARQAVANAMNAARPPVILTAALKRLVLLAEIGIEAKRMQNVFRVETEH